MCENSWNAHTLSAVRIPACNNPPLVCAAHTLFQVFGVSVLIEPPQPRLRTLPLHCCQYSQVFVPHLSQWGDRRIHSLQTENRAKLKGAEPRDAALSVSHTFQRTAPSIWYLCCSNEAPAVAKGVKFPAAGLSWRCNQSHGLRLWICAERRSSACSIVSTHTAEAQQIQCTSMLPLGLGNSPKAAQEPSNITQPPLKPAVITQTRASCRSGRY